MQEQSGTPQPARTPYRTPHLLRYGKLASLIEGGSISSPPESGTAFNSIPN